MKSIALTLAVLFATLSFAQAAGEANQQPATQEEVSAVVETEANGETIEAEKLKIEEPAKN